MAEWRDQAEVRNTVSCHGMRKTVGINLAENEVTEYEIMAVLGHTSPKATRFILRRRTGVAWPKMPQRKLL